VRYGTHMGLNSDPNTSMGNRREHGFGSAQVQPDVGSLRSQQLNASALEYTVEVRVVHAAN